MYAPFNALRVWCLQSGRARLHTLTRAPRYSEAGGIWKPDIISISFWDEVEYTYVIN